MHTVESPTRASSVSVKLDATQRERLKAVAQATQRTPHYIMKEALNKYLDEEENQQRFIAAAKESLAAYKHTGQHITLDEFSAWAKELRTNPQAVLAPCHT